MLDSSPELASPRRRYARARITNGTVFLPTVDGRTPWARLMRDTYHAVIQHCGGESAISELERLAARRIGALEAELIYFEDKIAAIRAAGGQPDAELVDLYSRVSSSQRRHCESLGWQRRARDVTPDIRTYLEQQGYAA
jgi:hypothetical protein